MNQREWEDFKHMTYRNAQRRQDAERGKIDPNTVARPPSYPPGEDWDNVIVDYEAFSKAGMCELWCVDWGNETRFARCQDLPPSFNTSGVWWRKA